MGKLIEQFLKFGVVGVIATIIDFGVLVFLHDCFGIDPIIAAAISFIVSLIFNYLASMRFVFTHREDLSKAREFAIFLVLSIVGFALNEFVMWGGELVLEDMGVNYDGGPYYVAVKVFATCIVMIWNFASRKKWLDASSEK